ncbi:MAG: exo-alpha-sialidase [Ktedonobacterales bacterium]|nr:exo-alpha-sialidase [Ktedonobacterales bacterium]
MLTLLLILGGCTLRGTSAPVLSPTPTVGGCLHASPPAPNVRVSHDAFLAHSEPMVAVNPRNPLNLVGGSKFFTDPQHYRFQIGTYASHDGGCTWRDGGVLPGFAPSATTSDVSFAFDAHNAAYVAVLNTDLGAQSGISVAKSMDGGDTFGLPVTVFEDTKGRVFSDKPWLGIDTTGGPHDGAIYVVWSYDPEQPPCATAGGPACDQELAFARSTDGGQTFSPVQLIEGSAPFCTYPLPGRSKDSRKCDGALGATPAILPDGTIAVAYAYLGEQKPTRLLVVTSHDGGTTWGPPVLVATANDSPVVFPPANFRNTTLPAFAADPTTGQLYIAWTEEQQQDANIVLATSMDGGKTWSAPVRVNDDPAGRGAIHIQPQLAVAPNGVVSVAFFDARLSLTPHLLDVFVAQSIDHGRSFLPNLRVTTQTWDTNIDEPKDQQGGNGFIGDYQGLAATNDFVYPFWNDTRTGAQEIFTAAVPSAHP